MVRLQLREIFSRPKGPVRYSKLCQPDGVCGVGKGIAGGVAEGIFGGGEGVAKGVYRGGEGVAGGCEGVARGCFGVGRGLRREL